jgi:hypothetical protein
MKVEIFQNNADFDFDGSCRFSFKPESLRTRHTNVFEFKLRLDSKQIGSKLFKETLWLWCPTLDQHLVIARFKWYNPNTIPSNGVSTFVVSLPNLKLEFGPAANSLALVMEIEGVIPHSELIYLVSYFLIGLSCVLAIDQSPVKSALDLELTKSP